MEKAYFKALFSNGTLMKRSSMTRRYTHAYLSIGSYISPTDGKTINHFRRHGFSTSEAQVTKNLAAETAWYQKQKDINIAVNEIVSVIEITALEYRAIRN